MKPISIESRASIEARLQAVKDEMGSKLRCHPDYNRRNFPAHDVPHSYYMQKVLRNAIYRGKVM